MDDERSRTDDGLAPEPHGEYRRSREVIAGLLAMAQRWADEGDGSPAVSELVASARGIAERLERREREFARLFSVLERINYGVSLDETLDFVYRELAGVIPYNRIGFSLIDEKTGRVVARWSRSDRPMQLKRGYHAPLEGSTLNDILRTGEPRILNDLEEYLARKPRSVSTQLIVSEGMRSSLTCPLLVRGRAVGFMFFSSAEKNTYADAHVDCFMQIAGQLSAIVEKGRLYTELDERSAVIGRQNEQMTRELDMARQVQRSLIPSRAPSVAGLDVALHWQPAIQVGGDLVDVAVLDDARTLFFVGDAMGHGVGAALVMSLVKAALNGAVRIDASPSQVLARINRTISEIVPSNLVTAACCLLDTSQQNAEVALAGHPPTMVFRRSDGTVHRCTEGGLPLGVDAEGEFSSERPALSPGDVLVFYTDGLIEATDPADVPYGLDRLADLVASHGARGAASLLDTLRDDLGRFCAGQPLKDDLTLLTVGVR